jgi:O-antigen ligase
VTYPDIAAGARRAAAWCMAGLGLAIPVSTAADTLVLGVIVIAAMLNAREAIGGMRRNVVSAPPMAAALVLFGWLLIACAYSTAPPKEAFQALDKYVDLMLIALLAWTVSDADVRRRALVCYAIAIVANLYVAYSAAAGLPGLRRPHYPIGFKASVTHNLMVSLGAFLFLLWAREAADRRWRIAYLALATLCAHNILFVVIGRTGYLVLGLLLIYFVMTSVRGWRGPLAAVLLVTALATATYFTSESFRIRVDEIATDFEQWKPGAHDATSVGQRIEYYRTTLDIIADHPWLGVGTGGFARAFAEKIRGTPAMATINPHNDYLLIGAQAGVPGMLFLLLLYGVTWRFAGTLGSRFDRDLLRGVVITMAVGGLFNSLLMDHTEGFLFAWFIALLCSRPASASPAGAAAQRA